MERSQWTRGVESMKNRFGVEQKNNRGEQEEVYMDRMDMTS